MGTEFDRHVERQQVAWRKRHVTSQEHGVQNGKARAWILPKGLWEEGLWAGIRSGTAGSLPEYLAASEITRHDGSHNLKSSWVICANLYFPFRAAPDLLAGFLEAHVCPEIARVDGVELEYAEAPPLDPHSLLGEPEGTRGANQTSPDVAFLVTTTGGGKGLVLTENKFTEHSFYECSGRKKEYGNPDPSRCMDLPALLPDLPGRCYMLSWERGRRYNRRYWEHVRLTDGAEGTLTRCPAATGGYQLLRQQALAEAIARHGPYDLVISCVAYDDRNRTLIECLGTTGIDDFRTGWSRLFDGRAQFATWSHQQWVEWVRQHDNGRWADWLGYVGERYGV